MKISLKFSLAECVFSNNILFKSSKQHQIELASFEDDTGKTNSFPKKNTRSKFLIHHF